MVKQIKSKKRVSTYGEVYTAPREVNAMLNLVGEESSKITSTFLEPACGNGNFLIAILDRKLESVKLQNVNVYTKSLNILRAVSSIYGVDIQKDNVEETKTRVRNLVETCYNISKCPKGHYGEAWAQMMNIILETNILCGNTLSAKCADGSDMKFSEWIISDDGYITRDEVRFQDMLDGTDSDSAKHTKYHYNVNVYIYKTA